MLNFAYTLCSSAMFVSNVTLCDRCFSDLITAKGGGTGSPPPCTTAQGGGTGSPPLCTTAQGGGTGSPPLCTLAQGGGTGSPPLCTTAQDGGTVPLPCAPLFLSTTILSPFMNFFA